MPLPTTTRLLACSCPPPYPRHRPGGFLFVFYVSDKSDS